MTLPICCEGDLTTHGGKVVKASGSFTIDGRRAARLGDPLTCPMHGISVIVQGDAATLDEGIPLALHGHRGACGCAVICNVNATVQP